MVDALGLRDYGRRSRLLSAVRGLWSEPKQLPPKIFYDARGSELFEEITRLPEYYLTRAERGLLEACVPDWIAALRPRSLVELGAGSAVKTRILLNAMRAAGTAERYVPVDVSAAFLHETAQRIREEYPGLQVTPLVADIGKGFEAPRGLPAPTVHAFLGSTIGNFERPADVEVIGALRDAMRPDDRVLLGVDLRKDVAVLEAAYNDSQGITAEFNRNALRVLNRELGADFDVDAFEHRAFYNRDDHRIEMHLVSTRPQCVTIPGAGTVLFGEGESIRTELSHKYDRGSVEELFSATGLAFEAWETDLEGRFALAVGAP